MKIIIKTAILNALATFLYVGLVASSFFYMSKFFGQTGKPDTILAPTVMLLLFVFSAGLTASLVFGRPILWYMDGKKKEAIHLLAYTLASLFVIIALVVLVMYSIAR